MLRGISGVRSISASPVRGNRRPPASPLAFANGEGVLERVLPRASSLGQCLSTGVACPPPPGSGGPDLLKDSKSERSRDAAASSGDEPQAQPRSVFRETLPMCFLPLVLARQISS